MKMMPKARPRSGNGEPARRDDDRGVGERAGLAHAEEETRDQQGNESGDQARDGGERGPP